MNIDARFNAFAICDLEYATAWGGVMLSQGRTIRVDECEASELVHVMTPDGDAVLTLSAEGGPVAALWLTPGMDETLTRHATLAAALNTYRRPNATQRAAIQQARAILECRREGIGCDRHREAA